ncbi:hypothetical protein SERLADRAFT_444171 [Serpula lacrymans var. lacrymans S7.9]|uniref:Uncharacterized protein n=1 Tax=Serpula lacrymans var. lacrymans (strain S7.9) TaxID=578457 RepID=F8PEQ0_SERL9|nr:uncharacterized protein SERLADRAFT_444171 [Serpula lacrymans var. lacrymans S7.9]EGO18396.1 hypothetical protein SERLADRAFT_444171 [Serpula lacrymans var. lacrymans S7.9]
MVTPNEWSTIKASTHLAQFKLEQKLLSIHVSNSVEGHPPGDRVAAAAANSVLKPLEGRARPWPGVEVHSFFSGINLLNAMELSPDFSPGPPSPPVLKFIERIEHADPHPSDFDKDNHGNCKTARHLIAAAVKTCQNARYVCFQDKIHSLTFLADKYLSNILDLLWAAWKTAKGPISKGKALSDLSLFSTLCWTVLIISSTTSASMAPPSSISTVSALTVLASVAASVLSISQVTAGDSDSPNEEECCAEFQTLKKNELIEWIKTSGVTVSNLKQRNKKGID